MQKVYGIYFTGDGTTVFTALGITEKNAVLLWSRRFDGKGFLKKQILLDQGVTIGLPSNWIRSTTSIPGGFKQANYNCSSTILSPIASKEIKAPAQEKIDVEIQVSQNNSFSALTQESLCDIQCENFKDNLLGAVPDDAFLCSVPCYFRSERSFISVFQSEASIKIGVIIEGELKTVFTFPVFDEKRIEKHIARIERYWKVTFPGSEFPNKVMQINGSDEISLEGYTTQRLDLPEELFDEGVLKSAGIALSSGSRCVMPRFTGASAESRFRRVRTGVLVFSGIIIAAMLVFSAVFLGADFWAGYKLNKCEKEYRNLLSNNPEIRALLTSGDSLSTIVMNLQNTLSRPTRWARFLEAIGERRPKGLYFEQLGSETMQGGKIRIALSGWAEEETIVTEMMKALQEFSFIQNASLVSMDRDSESKNICRFKVICTLKLEKD